MFREHREPLPGSCFSPTAPSRVAKLFALPRFSLGRSLFDVVDGLFDERLALFFAIRSKYPGMSPWDCLGLFAISYIEHGLGITQVTGGLSRISDAMAGVAVRHGAMIRCSAPGRRVIVESGRNRGVELAGGECIEADEWSSTPGVTFNLAHNVGQTRSFRPRNQFEEVGNCDLVGEGTHPGSGACPRSASRAASRPT